MTNIRSELMPEHKVFELPDGQRFGAHKHSCLFCKRSLSYRECANEHRQLAEWLKELKALKDFAKFVAESVLSEDFEENSDFYAEVLCRKLTKLGKLKVVDNKYMEVNADEDDITNNNDMFIND